MKFKVFNYIFYPCIVIFSVSYGCAGGSASHLSNETELKINENSSNAIISVNPDTVIIIDDNDSLKIIYQTIQKDSESQMLLKVLRNKNELFSRTISKNDIFTDDLPFKSKIIMKHYYYTDFDKKNKEIIFTIDTKDPDMEVTVVVDLKGKLEVVAD